MEQRGVDVAAGSVVAPATWLEIPAAPTAGKVGARWRGIALRAVVMGLVAAFLAYEGSTIAAAVLFALAAVLAIGASASARFADVVDRSASAFGRTMSVGVTAVGAAALELVVGMPGRLIYRFRRSDPLVERSTVPRSAWRARLGGDTLPRHLFDADIPRSRNRKNAGRRTRPLNLVGWLVILLVVDLVVGSIVNRVSPTDLERAERVVTPIEVGLSRAEADHPDTLAGLPAFRGDAWAGDYFHELQSVKYLFAPYITLKAQDFKGKYVTITGGHRSGEGVSAPAKAPVVWFFGGSTMFGEGQRDDHTLPAEIARQAAAAGHPISVVNYGRPGFTAYQEALLLEQLLAHQKAPDLVVFYDGANDLYLHHAYPVNQPTAFPETVRVSAHPGGRLSLSDQWANHSLAYRLFDWLRGGPASAAPSATPVSIDEQGRQAASVYARSVSLAQRIAREHHLPTAFFFQPTRQADGLVLASRVRGNLPSGVVDLSDALDGPGQDTYFDAVHTNEKGAMIVAQRLAQLLLQEPTIRDGGH